jgi:starch-binding outer membrane protein, SusD/RagB family
MTRTLSLLGLGLTLSAVACSGLLDVDNPNNIKGEDIPLPTAATPLLNGVHSALARGINAVVLPIATVSDELDWVGSRDAWRQLEYGDLSDPFNEFTDAAYPSLAQARWMADEAIRIMKRHRDSGFFVQNVAVDPVLLARAYFYGGLAYVTIGDLFDRWAFSDQRVAAAPLAPDQMRQVYDTAIAYLDRGYAFADSLATAQVPNPSAVPWRLAMAALRARAKHARAVWDMIGRVPTSPATITNQGLVSDAGALADAQLAISLLASADWRYDFRYSATSVAGDFGGWVNDRQEMRLGDVYVVPSANNKSWSSIRLTDPIAGTPDPALRATADSFKTKATYPTFTALSARELHLLVAEIRLAQADTAGFTTSINAVRSLNGLPAYDPANAAHPRPRDMLIYERQVNLFLQGRRLADMYRFQINYSVTAGGKWQTSSEAVTQPGRVLPLTARECLANPLIGGANCRI